MGLSFVLVNKMLAVNFHIHTFKYILIRREVGALEMVELIQGVRMGLGQYQISILFFLMNI